MLSKFSTREKVLLVLVAGLILYAPVLFIFNPMSEEQSQLNETRTILEQEIATLSVALPAPRGNLGSGQESPPSGSHPSQGSQPPQGSHPSPGTETIFWRDVSLPGILEEIGNQAKGSGVEILEIRQDASGEGGEEDPILKKAGKFSVQEGIDRISGQGKTVNPVAMAYLPRTIHLSVRAQFIRLGEYLYAIEGLPLPVVVESFRMGNTENPMAIEMDFSLRLYEKVAA